ncbi:hypothetical protein [Methanobacterium sp. BAmetb5]|uniref:hypothetical protein n=1 Tax=Methanobacterium sp. BAmetb5 TaxID=2025351 RepID=UPI000E8C0C98|nr:hypothetical protein [Methanobacterium sp. BAmetb5]AXV40389.1 MAG: hypothetical protein CIT02_08685 [Methanobacterium sp. BAmetb5]
MWKKYIIFALSILVIVAIIFIYITSLNQPQYSPILSILAIIIGATITMIFNLVLDEQRIAKKEGKLISAIRAKNANNVANATANCEALEKEISDIKSTKVDMWNLLIPLHDLLPLNEIMEDINLLIEKESIKLPIIASEIEFLNKDMKIRQDLILENKVSIDIIIYRDKLIVNSLKSFIETVEEYEKDIFGDVIKVETNKLVE